MALKVLSALDTAKTQYYHFKAIIIAGMGLFSDAYDLFCIPPIMRLIGRIYYPNDVGKNEEKLYEIPSVVASTMIGIALLGAVIGNLVFGRLGDLVGRRRVYGVSLLLMVVSSFGCGLSMSTSTELVLASLGFFRFFLGIGIGGDYPLSATIMSEFANKRTRGAFIAAVFSMQGFGILLGSIVTMIVCAAFRGASHLEAKSKHVPAGTDVAWRLILMIGAVPAAMTYYWRMKMPETARYTALVEKNALQAAKDMEKVLNVSLSQIAEDVEMIYTPMTTPNFSSNNTYPLLSKEFLRCHGRDLFASSASWFLLDVVFYSLNLFPTHVFRPYIPSKLDMNAFEDAFQVAKFQATVVICSTIPGYFATVYLIDHIGRVKIQIMGFFCMAISLLTIGLVYGNDWNSESEANFGFIVLYGLTFFFSNFGPNTTTFIVPAELFPARFRATCHGISGAAGKVGAIIGSVGFLWASREENGIGMRRTLMILGGVCVMGMVVTYFFTRETVGRSLEENEKQDDYTGVWFLRCLPSSSSCLKPQSSVNDVADAPGGEMGM